MDESQQPYSYAGVPYLDTQEALLLSEIDPQRKFQDLVYDPRLNAPPTTMEIDNGAREIAKSRPPMDEDSYTATSGSGNPSGGFIGALLSTLVPMIPSIVSGITSIVDAFKKKGKGKCGGAPSPATMGRGGSTSSYAKRLAKFMSKNKNAMLMAEANSIKGSGFPDLYKQTRKYAKAALMTVNQLSPTAASVAATKYVSKLLPPKLVSSVATSMAKRGQSVAVANLIGLTKYVLARAGVRITPEQKRQIEAMAARFMKMQSLAPDGAGIKEFWTRLKDLGRKFMISALPSIIKNIAPAAIDGILGKIGIDNKTIRELLKGAAETGSEMAEKALSGRGVSGKAGRRIDLSEVKEALDETESTKKKLGKNQTKGRGKILKGYTITKL